MQSYATRRRSSRLGLGDTETLTGALRTSAERSTGGVVYVRADGMELAQSYAELLADAERIACALRAHGLKSGDHVLLQLEAGEDFIPGFWACVLAGVVAVPVGVAPTFSHPNSALQKLLNAAKLFESAPVLASAAAVEGLRRLPPALGTLTGAVLDLSELRRGSADDDLPQSESDDVAVLLLTSGSTGQPKGVPLTHRNLLAMARGTIEANGFTPAEVTLNWMALDHVGSVSFLGTMAAALGCTQIHVPTGYILQEPLRWLDLISRHRASISWAPNFAFTLFLDRADAVQAGNWDLRSMRFLVNAGEPVVARTARKFITLLQNHGLPVGALRPAFGMSETCSGITWSRGLTLENTSDDQAFVDLGPAIPGAEMRVVNEAGAELPEGESGMLQLRGPSVFSGYFRNAEENARVFKDGWFETGDLAFLQDGCLHIAGRLKDVIIVNGANFYCHEIEAAAETVPGLLKTFTAACAVRDAMAETDQLALFFCVDGDQRAKSEALARALRARLLQQVGLAPAYLIALETSEVPKTEIGKIQRAQLKKAFESGTYRERLIGAARANPVRVARQRAKSRGELATAIAEIWQEVLGLDRVGHDETFFELGGHSLLIVQVQVRLQELMGRAVPVVELFNCPTVRTMAEHFARDFEAGERSAGAPASTTDRAKVPGGDIAIVGIGLRFPGASNPEAFWQLLAEEREAITFFTAEQALAAGVDPELVRNPNHVRAAPLLDAPDAFDAEFFRYNAKEARMLDPQQRVFLEVCWEAFEDAGYDPLTFPGKVGLFAASGMNTYLLNNLWANDRFLQDENGGRLLTVDSMNGFNVMITNDKDYLPMRVSYKLNLHGPSVNVQSACSSTLLTLHEACKSLRAGDCEMALAGGVSIKLPQHAGHLYSPGMLNSPDGHCRAYDEKAEGTIFGNGAGVVLLKPLSAALAAGDRVYAVVKGTASNNDGAGKVGFTAPSSSGQEDVCAEALARAGVSAESVTFMEGHGTGTALGDPIEVNALSTAFRRHTARAGFCALGSVKTNVGHLQIASGIAGLIKTTLALHHRKIPGTLHFERPNPRIDFSATPFFVSRQTIDWASSGGPRRAGVNSLGIGGTNVHAILEEAPAPAASAPATATRRSSAACVVPLSARQPAALRELAMRYVQQLTGTAAESLEEIAFTAQVGRAALPVRAAFVANSREDFMRQLEAFVAVTPQPREPLDFDARGVAFHFSGRGMAGRARQLWETEPVFRQAAEMCVSALEEASDRAVERVDDATKLPAGFASDRGELPDIFVFVFEYALAELLASYGIEPAAVSGDGVGEFVAGCRAGVFSMTDAVRLVIARERWLAGAGGPDDAGALNRVVTAVEFSPPAQRCASRDHGQWLAAELADGAHWLRRAMDANHADGARGGVVVEACSLVIEIGAEAPSSAATAHHIAAADFARLLADLFTLGYPIRWRQGRQLRPARRVRLPTYAWQHQSYWVEPVNLRAAHGGEATATANPLLGRRWRSPRVKSCVYETRFDPASLPYLREHRVHGAIVTPGALYLSQVALQAADFLDARSDDGKGVRLSEIVFVSAMVIDPAHPRTVQTVFTPDDAGGHAFEVISWTEMAPNDVVVHATGRCQVERMEPSIVDVAQLRATLQPAPDITRHYAIMDQMEVRLGASFRWIGEMHRGERQSLLRLVAPVGLEECREWHPGLVDSFLQAAVSAIGLDGARTLIPFRMDRVCFHRNPDGRPLYAHAQHVAADATVVRADIRLYDTQGRLVAEALGFELRNLQARDVETAATAKNAAKYFETIWEPVGAPAATVDPRAPGSWLFLSEGDAATRALQRSLQNAGATVREVTRSRAAEAESLLATQDWSGVVYAWDLATTQPGALAWRKLLGCVKAAAARAGRPARWVFLTSSGSNSLAQSPLAGFVTGLAHEHPDWHPLQLEMDPADAAMDEWVPWLFDSTAGERRLARRDGSVCGQRLVERTITSAAKAIRADGTYLVTGGGGALGQSVVAWLIDRGAQSLCLAGRRPASAELQSKMVEWQQRGVTVTYVVADLADARSVHELVARASARQPLRGVFHAAGALRDGLLRQAEADAFTSVLGAKIDGAWALHEATKGQTLDVFVMFSSIASLLGSPGQANYAAGNAFMDALARERRVAGLPGLSIQWGPWDGIGMTARLAPRDRARLEQRGLRAMAPADALRALERLTGDSGCVGVFAWDRRAYRAGFNGHLPAFYRRILGTETPAAAPARPAAVAGRDFGVLAPAARAEAIERLIRETVATLLGLDSYSAVDREKGLFDLGIDSLTAIDLKDRLEKALGHTLRSTIAFDYPTAAGMAAHLAETLFPAGASAAPVTSAAPDDLSSLSAADLEALLEKELED